MPADQEREFALFALALEKPAAERASFLDAACGTDRRLRERLEALLAAHDQPDSRLTARTAANRPTLEIDLDESHDESAGQTIGRYQLLEKVGEGGCGVVYVAEQTEPVRRRVALKIIKLGMDTKAVVARFEAERQALAMMDHPSIAKVLDAGTTELGRPFFVMELVRGVRITDYCDQANLTTKERIDLFIKVCKAIQHAHQKGIIHRDIKPSNILVTLHDGVPVPKVIDFGIAKATEGRLTDATVYTQLHQFIGTPAYMSPEQAEMSGLDIDTRSDIYSLGVLLYELLVGSTPFDARELIALGLEGMRRKIREKEPLRPSTRIAGLTEQEQTTTAKRRSTEVSKLVHQLRGDLDWVVMKCLEKDRTRRYETANDLATDLKRHLDTEPVVARPPSASYRFQKMVVRNKLAFATATAMATALLLGAGVSTWQMFAARRAQKEAEAAREGEQRQRLAAESAQRIAEDAQRNADAQARRAVESQRQARRLLYASDMNNAQQALKMNNRGKARLLLDRHRPKPGEEDLRGWEWRYLWQQTRSGALTTLTNRPARGFDVSFSPDGAHLAVGWFDGQVDLWDVQSQRLIRNLSAPNQGFWGRVAFSPVRNLVAATAGKGSVTFYDLEAGTESVAWRGAEGWSVNKLSFSPDGSRLLVYGVYGFFPPDHSVNDEVWVILADSGRIEAEHGSAFRSGSQHHGATAISPDNRRLYLTDSDSRNYRCAIRCLDLADGTELWRSETLLDFGVTELALSPDGAVLASGTGFEDPSIRIWDARTGQSLYRLEGHTGWISKLAFAADGRRLFSAAADQTIRVWDTKSWTEARVLRGHSDEVEAVAVSADASLIASAGKDGNLMLWRDDANSTDVGYALLPENFRTSTVMPLGQSRMLIASPQGSSLLDLKQRGSPVLRPVLAPPALPLGSFGSNTLCYWDGTNQILVGEFRETNFVGHSSFELKTGVVPVMFSLDVERDSIAWTEAHAGAVVHASNLRTPARRTELQSNLTAVEYLLFSPNGAFLAAATRSGVRVWQLETGRIVASNDDPIYDVAFAMGGSVFVAAIRLGQDHEFRMYDLRDPEHAPRSFPGKDVPRRVAVSPDGRLVAGCTGAGEWKLFDAIKGELISSIRGHMNGAFGVAFSPDGRRLMTTSGAREALKIWDFTIQQELLVFSGSGSWLPVAGWNPAGGAIFTSFPAQVWYAPSWEEIAAAEAAEGSH